ncbi:hypothetical protein CFC21_033258 [Triticum aestivum]|uniref:Uncharacterized protein n=3 Tax=Triticum TaxID=4564 RepID=A0A9R0R7Z4_TRITD|nr:hypothetical protein CFC21_033258 [Triticum aestivum]VAH55754.1 unnamed protein product [Triticum turgidum subsp. durum]
MEAWRKTTMCCVILFCLMATCSEVSSTENMCYHNHWNKCHPDQNGMCRDSCVKDGWDDGQCRNRFKRLMGAKCECYPKTCDH